MRKIKRELVLSNGHINVLPAQPTTDKHYQGICFCLINSIKSLLFSLKGVIGGGGGEQKLISTSFLDHGPDSLHVANKIIALRT